MEKEIASFIELEDRIDTVINLVSKLKEDNQKLIEENAQLKNMCLELEKDGSVSQTNIGLPLEDSGKERNLNSKRNKAIEKHVKSALVQLEQLRQTVLNGK